MNKTVELKPCPFCGGKAILNASHSVECVNACICPVIPRTWTYDTDEEGIEAWNHRIPTVDAISKDQYEVRLKADLVTILTELQLEIEEMKMEFLTEKEIWNNAINVCSDRVQEKINTLKEQTNEQ